MEFNGTVGPGYEVMAEVMVRNLEPTEGEKATDPGDLGAALAVVHHGETVVDIWTGDEHTEVIGGPKASELMSSAHQ